MDLERAIDFVRRQGSDFERARLMRLLGENFEAALVLEGFGSVQNPDGGFPFGDIPGMPSCLSNTSQAIQLMDDLGLADSETARKAIAFLTTRMTTNGTWSENEKILPLDPPEWDMPGDSSTRIWLTADISDMLMRLGVKVPRRTASFLMKHQGENGRFDGYEHATWIAISAFGSSGFGEPDVQARALAYLETTEIGDWEVSSIAWCLRSMRRGGISESTHLWRRLTDRLSETQVQDGAWPGAGGELHRACDANSVLAAVLLH